MRPKLCLIIVIVNFLNTNAIYTPTDNASKQPKSVVMHHNYSQVNRQRYVNPKDADIYQENRDPKLLRNSKDVDVEFVPSASQNIPKNYYSGASQKLKKVQVFDKCPKGVTGQFVYSQSCNQFLNCWKGRGYPQNCAAGTLFNPQTSECDFAEKVKCMTGPEMMQDYPRNERMVQARCPKDFQGNIPDYKDCKKYISCRNGAEEIKSCPVGSVFSTKSNNCVYSKKVACINDDEGDNIDPGYTNLITNRQPKHDVEPMQRSIQNSPRPQNPNSFSSGPRPGPVKCSPSSGVMQPHPTDCTKFLECHGGTIVKDCPPGTHFSKALGLCDYPSNAQCQSKPPTPDSRDNEWPYMRSKPNALTLGDPDLSGQTPDDSDQPKPGQTTGRAFPEFGVKPPSRLSQYEPDDLVGRPTNYRPQPQSGSRPPYRPQDNSKGPGQVPDDFFENPTQNRPPSRPSYSPQDNSKGPGQLPDDLFENPQNRPSSRPSYSPQDNSKGRGQLPDDFFENPAQNRPSSRPPYSPQGPGQLPDDFFENPNYAAPNRPVGPSSRPSQGAGDLPDDFFINPAAPSRPTGPVRPSNRPPYNPQGPGQLPDDYNGNPIYYRPQIGQNRPPGPYRPQLNNKGQTYSGQQETPDDSFGGPTYTRPQIDQNRPPGPYGPQSNIGQQRPPRPFFPQSGQNRPPGPYGPQGNIGQNRPPSAYYPQGPTYPGQGQLPDDSYDNPTYQINPNQPRPPYQPVPAPQYPGYRPPGAPDQSGDRNRPQNPNYFGGRDPNYKGVWSTGDELYMKPTMPTYPWMMPDPYQTTTTTTTTTERSNYRPGGGRSYDQVTKKPDHNPSSSEAPKPNKPWPPPFPTPNPNTDYVFEYDDFELDSMTTTKKPPSDSHVAEPNNWCDQHGFECFTQFCIAPAKVCDGTKDCKNGKDEDICAQALDNFALTPNTKLAVREKLKINNVTLVGCAKYCLEMFDFQCKAFNYRKHDSTCYLMGTNVGMTGALIMLPMYDYFEHKKYSVSCNRMFECRNKKCINSTQICDGINDCGDWKDEKGCIPESFGYKISLAGSPKPNEGRIEVQAFGKSGYICDDMFGLRSADVACRELGFHLGAIQVKGNSYFASDVKDNETFYIMDDVTCMGNETTLMNCDFSGWGIHNCKVQEIVGVICKTPQTSCAHDQWACKNGMECLETAYVCDGIFDCSDQSDEDSLICEAPIEIRLSDGQSPKQGRIEIQFKGIWGTVCDDDFNDDAAKVVCSQLGFAGNATVKKDGFFGPGEGPIWLDQVFCRGNESDLIECEHWDWGTHNCEHAEDVGIMCGGETVSKGKSSQGQRQVEHFDPQTSGQERSAKAKRLTPKLPMRCGERGDSIFFEPDVHFRVVQGSKARKGEYPWQASIRVKGHTSSTHWCGAVIISEQFVLTAAHCLMGYTKGSYVIVAGDYNVDDNEGTEQTAHIEDFMVHEQFRSGNKMNNDIAVILLKGRGFELNKDVQAICLPESDFVYEPGKNCTISGFGSVQSGKSSSSKDLRAGWVPLQSKQVCSMPHVYGEALTDGMICAGALEEGVDACDGDSGGPLACLHEGAYTLYGITSWGHHCGHANRPGVYVKVAVYKDWILRSMSKLYKNSS